MDRRPGDEGAEVLLEMAVGGCSSTAAYSSEASGQRVAVLPGEPWMGGGSTTRVLSTPGDQWATSPVRQRKRKKNKSGGCFNATIAFYFGAPAALAETLSCASRSRCGHGEPFPSAKPLFHENDEIHLGVELRSNGIASPSASSRLVHDFGDPPQVYPVCGWTNRPWPVVQDPSTTAVVGLSWEEGPQGPQSRTLAWGRSLQSESVMDRLNYRGRRKAEARNRLAGAKPNGLSVGDRNPDLDVIFFSIAQVPGLRSGS